MTRALLEGARTGRFDLALVLVLGACVFLPGLGAHDLWNPDEPRYAQVAREMLEHPSWLVPRLENAVYSEKPPLMFWAVMGTALIRGGVDETSARLPSALSGMALLLLVYLSGRLVFDRRPAWIATIVAGSTMTLLWQGHVGQIDMLLTALELGAVYAWLRTWGDPSAGWWWPWVLAGLATLAKGPVGLIVPMGGIVLFLLVTRDRDGLSRLRLLPGFAIWAAIVAAWLVPAALTGGAEYVSDILVRQNATRFANPWGHIRPWYYFATTIPVDFLPWTLFLPAIAVGAAAVDEPRARRAVGFLAVWIAFTVIFFSLSPGKRGLYVLSIYPGLALLAGAAFDRFADAEGPRSRPRAAWFALCAAACGIVLVSVATAIPSGVAREPAAGPLGGLFPILLAIALAPAGLAGIVGGGLAIVRRPVDAVATLAAGMILTSTLVVTGALPMIDRVKSARPLSEILSAYSRPGEPIGIHPKRDEAFLFYTDRPMTVLPDAERLEAFAEGGGRRWLLAERDDLDALGRPLPLVEVARDEDELEGYVLLTTPPWPPETLAPGGS